MKRKLIFALMAALTTFAAFSEVQNYTSGSLDAPDMDETEIDTALLGVHGTMAPFITGDYAVFTADKNARYVGIAFDFEKYRTIHKFQLKTDYDSEENASSKYYVYVLKIPKNVQSFNYRMVIDGLWTTDPMNPEKIYSEEAKLIVSHLNANRTVPIITEEVPVGKVRFVYTGKSGQKIRLGGSFTNWDSWIYIMREVYPGVYQLDLPLPPGTYEYAYYNGMNTMVDPTNPERVYTRDGKSASLLVVK